MKFQTLAIAAGFVMASAAHAAVNDLTVTNGMYLGAFGAPANYGDAFSTSQSGLFSHSLTFDITEDLYAGSGVSNIPLQLTYGAFTLSLTNITGLSAKIYDSSDNLHATFVQAGDANHLTLPANSLFTIDRYTLKVGGTAVGTGNTAGMYTVAAVTVPVPEPETWGMLLAGLGLVGLRLRQKIRGSDQTMAA